MPEKRRHHYIPQFYLRGFASNDKPFGRKASLWVRDVRTGSIGRRTPSNLAVEIGYYAVESERGMDYLSVENELARMEDQAASALRRFLNRAVGNRRDIEPEIGNFIAWLACRVPWFRGTAVEGWREHLDDMAWGRVEVEEDHQISVLLVDRSMSQNMRLPLRKALDAIRSGHWIAQLDQNQFIDMMRLQRWYFLTEHFPNLFWTILTAPPGDSFIVSDRPVVWYVPERGFADRPVGLRFPDVELTVPLNSETALLATAAPPPAGTQISTSDVNFRTRCFAERFVAAANMNELADERACFA